MRNIIARRSVMIFENDKIGDEYWTPYVAKALRNLADILDAKRGLRGGLAERYETSDGTCVTILSGTWLGELLSLQDAPSESQDQSQKQTPPCELVFEQPAQTSMPPPLKPHSV